jgi:hypothetical protein
MNKRMWTIFVLGVLVGVALAGYLVYVWPYLTRDSVGRPHDELPQAVEGGLRPTTGQFVGYAESSIVERFGLPSQRWQGHYGAPLARRINGSVAAMWEDPIVAEVHRTREKLAAESDYDVTVFFAGLRKRQAASGAKLVRPQKRPNESLPPTLPVDAVSDNSQLTQAGAAAER